MIIRRFEGPRKGTLIEYKCDICNETRISTRKIFSERSEHYCSRKCAYKSPIRSQKLSLSLKGKPGHPCGEEQRRKQSLALKGRKLSPERKEKAIAVLKAFPQKGISRSLETRKKISENNAWKGKVVPWFEPWMTFDLTFWRNEIRNLFEKRCAKCDSKDNLHAHHIVPTSVSPERSFDLNNGILLCKTCHLWAHKLLRSDSNQYQNEMNILLTKKVQIVGMAR